MENTNVKLVTNIEWDTDNENIKLPDEIKIPIDLNEDQIENYLSDLTGFLVISYVLEK